MRKINIHSGKWEASFVPECGMNTYSVRCGGEIILREAKSLSAFAEDLLLYGIPVIMPANRTKGARFEFEGKEYVMPMNEPERGNNLHGDLYCSAFEVTEHTENTVRSRIVNRGEHYPFPFTLTFIDTVTKDGYRREAIIRNDGEGNMPYTFALHSTFAEPESFSVPVGERYEWDENYIPTGKTVPLDEFEKSMLTSCIPAGREISAPYSSAGSTARIGKYLLTVSDNFDYWVFYNGNGHEGYICVEPQCGEVNGLNTLGHRILGPGETETFCFGLSEVL